MSGWAWVTGFLARLDGVKRCGWGWQCRCPAHNDGHASLSVREGTSPDGRRCVKIKCHAGCDSESVLRALGLEFKDLYEPRPPKAEVKRTFKRDYSYRDLQGREVHQTVRMEPKHFYQRHRDPKDPKRWINNLKGVETVLYRLPEISQAIARGVEIYLCEGEKDVEAMVHCGLEATCNPMGAGSWDERYSRMLRGARVCIVRDRDDAGYEHAWKVWGALEGHVEGLRCVEAAEGKDAFDHLKAGLTAEDFEPVPHEQVAREAKEARDRQSMTAAERRAARQAAEDADLELERQAELDCGVGTPLRVEPSPSPSGGRGGSGGRGFAPSGDGIGRTYNCTDVGNAERLVDRFGGDLRYCHVYGKWLTWQGSHWEIDETGGGAVQRMAIEVVRGMGMDYAEGRFPDGVDGKEFARWMVASESRRSIEAMIALARGMAGIPVTPDELDTDPWLAGCPNGTLDLRTGTLRAARREDLITRRLGCAYDPDAQCPEFMAHLNRALGDDQEALEFFIRAMGYSLTGITREECFFFLYGPGGSGKGTVTDVLFDMMGSYADVLRTESLMVRLTDSIPNDIAKLKGARLVQANETGEGRRWNEELLKNLTGRDVVTARFMRGEEFNYRPQFKLWLTGNNRPEFRTFDDAIERRLQLVPFPHKLSVEERDVEHKSRIREHELPGVLALAVRGCLEWQRARSLRAPSVVTTAVADYRELSDRIGRFLDEECEVEIDVFSTLQTPARRLYGRFCKWCKENGEYADGEKRFAEKLQAKGLIKRRSNRNKFWTGVQLIEQEGV